jgi:hypothetical protein
LTTITAKTVAIAGSDAKEAVRQRGSDDQRIELMQKIQKHQFKIGTLGGRPAPMPELWSAVLAA